MPSFLSFWTECMWTDKIRHLTCLNLPSNSNQSTPNTPQTSYQMSTPIIQSRPVEPHVQLKCTKCQVQVEFKIPSPSPPPATTLQVRCFNCQNIFTHTIHASNQSSTATSSKRGGRKIGTQDRPLETGYYDTLEVPVDATTADIKKAYSSFSPILRFFLC